MEIVGSTIGNNGNFNIQTATLTFTSDSATSLIVVAVGYRRNASQTVNQVALDTTNQLVLSTAIGNFSMYAGLWYIQNPSAGSHSINVTLSGATSGLSMSAIGFSNSTTAPSSPGFNATQNVTTSSATATANANDILMDFEVKQDSTTSQPTMNTAAATLQQAWIQQGTTSGGAGTSGWCDMSTLICSAGTNRINYSWSGAANHSHVWTVIKP